MGCCFPLIARNLSRLLLPRVVSLLCERTGSSDLQRAPHHLDSDLAPSVIWPSRDHTDMLGEHLPPLQAVPHRPLKGTTQKACLLLQRGWKGRREGNGCEMEELMTTMKVMGTLLCR